MPKVILIGISLFCLAHIIRDFLQIKYGYKFSWFTRFGHVWHAPKYEIHGIVVFFLAGSLSLLYAFR